MGTAVTAVALDIGFSLLLHRVNEQFYRPFGPAAEGLSPSVFSIALSPVVMFAALALAMLVMVLVTLRLPSRFYWLAGTVLGVLAFITLFAMGFSARYQGLQAHAGKPVFSQPAYTLRFRAQAIELSELDARRLGLSDQLLLLGPTTESWVVFDPSTGVTHHISKDVSWSMTPPGLAWR